jgi:hypothetical protein
MNGTTLTKVIGFESGPVPLTNGTGKPKNLRSNHTGRIRLRIRNLIQNNYFGTTAPLSRAMSQALLANSTVRYCVMLRLKTWKNF